MPLGSVLPIRLETDVEERLDGVAQQIGTTKSAIIRLLAKTFVDQVVNDRGKVTLPPNWKELLPAADARSTGGTAKPTLLDKRGFPFNSKVAAAAEGAQASAVEEVLRPGQESRPSAATVSTSDNKASPKRGTVGRQKPRSKPVTLAPK